MSKGKDLRKQMKKQLKAFEEQIETFGEQANTVEAASLQRTQERLVGLVDAMDAQLKVWQNGMTAVNPKSAEAKPSAPPTNLFPELTVETTALWDGMEKQIQIWRTTTASMRMAVGADVQWQLETLRSLNTTANEKLRTLKDAQNGSLSGSKKATKAALDDLEQALGRVFPV